MLCVNYFVGPTNNMPYIFAGATIQNLNFGVMNTTNISDSRNIAVGENARFNVNEH